MSNLMNGVEDIKAVLDYLPIRLYMFVMWNECLCKCFANLVSFGEVLFNRQILITLLFNEVLYFGFWNFLVKVWIHSGEYLVNLGHVLVNGA